MDDDEQPYVILDDSQSVTLSLQDDDNKPEVSKSIVQNNKPRLKLYRGLILLAFVQFCIGIFVFLLGISCASLERKNLDRTASCPFGTGIWVGVLCIIAATNGFMALRVPHGKRGFMVAYMVFCIISSVADSVLIVFSGIWMSYHKYDFIYFGDSQSLARICLNAFLLIAGCIHTILSIISSAFLCYNFNCCAINKSDIVTIYAVANPDGTITNTESIKFLRPDVVTTQNNSSC